MPISIRPPKAYRVVVIPPLYEHNRKPLWKTITPTWGPPAPRPDPDPQGDQPQTLRAEKG